jgi:hypothetical protein
VRLTDLPDVETHMGTQHVGDGENQEAVYWSWYPLNLDAMGKAGLLEV